MAAACTLPAIPKNRQLNAIVQTLSAFFHFYSILFLFLFKPWDLLPAFRVSLIPQLNLSRNTLIDTPMDMSSLVQVTIKVNHYIL